MERQALLHGEQDLPDPEEPDHRHDEVEALHELRDAEGQPELPGDDVEADGGEDEPEQDRDRLERVPPPSPTNAENVRSWIAKNSGGPNLSATSARSGANRVIRTTENRAPTKDDVNAAVSACPPWPCAPSGSRRTWSRPTTALRGC